MLKLLFAAVAAAKPPHQTFAWYHPPKTGTSLGTVIAHAANRSLPPCARISTCDIFAPAASTKSSLESPYAPHRCYGATDRFMERFPRKVWFRHASFVPGPPVLEADKWGRHVPIDDETFATHRGSFYGNFRSPPRLMASEYIRLVELNYCGSNGHTSRGTWAAPGCQDRLDFSKRTAVHGFVEYAKNNTGEMAHYLFKSIKPGSSPGQGFARLVAERLDGFKYVGLTDEWATSICLFHQIHGGYPCSPAELMNTRPTAAPPPDYEHIFRRHGLRDELDEVVYAAALARYRADLKKWNVTRRTCRRLRCTDTSWPRDSCPGDSDHA